MTAGRATKGAMGVRNLQHTPVRRRHQGGGIKATTTRSCGTTGKVAPQPTGIDAALVTLEEGSIPRLASRILAHSSQLLLMPKYGTFH